MSMLSLDGQVVASNARAWIAFSGLPLLAVVKCDGYGWGYEPLIRALDGIVQSFCVTSVDELREVRKYTRAPAIVLGNVPRGELRAVLDDDAQPSISTREELAIASEWARARQRPLRTRIAVQSAAAWGGMNLKELAAFAPELAREHAEVDLWMHFPDAAAIDAEMKLFEDALAILRAAGVNARAADLCSTFPLSRGHKLGDAVRVGIGLFGATGSTSVPGIACAIRFESPVLRTERHSAGTRLGYAGTMLRMDSSVATVRCGYGDGLPASLQGKGDVVMIGMQYAAVRSAQPPGSQYVWLDRGSDLDAFANAVGRPVHEIVTTLGNCARAAKRG